MSNGKPKAKNSRAGAEDIDALFAQARRAQPEPGFDLMARIIADAQAQQTLNLAPPSPTVGLQPGKLTQVLTLLGGWAGMAGLSAATLAGVWIGIAGPETLMDPLYTAFGSGTYLDVIEPDSGFDFTRFEG